MAFSDYIGPAKINVLLQIDIEKKKNAEENLSKIMKDYKQMKKENTELMRQLKQG